MAKNAKLIKKKKKKQFSVLKKANTYINGIIKMIRLIHLFNGEGKKKEENDTNRWDLGRAEWEQSKAHFTAGDGDRFVHSDHVPQSSSTMNAFFNNKKKKITHSAEWTELERNEFFIQSEKHFRAKPTVNPIKIYINSIRRGCNNIFFFMSFV